MCRKIPHTNTQLPLLLPYTIYEQYIHTLTAVFNRNLQTLADGSDAVRNGSNYTGLLKTVDRTSSAHYSALLTAVKCENCKDLHSEKHHFPPTRPCWYYRSIGCCKKLEGRGNSASDVATPSYTTRRSASHNRNGNDDRLVPIVDRLMGNPSTAQTNQILIRHRSQTFSFQFQNENCLAKITADSYTVSVSTNDHLLV